MFFQCNQHKLIQYHYHYQTGSFYYFIYCKMELQPSVYHNYLNSSRLPIPHFIHITATPRKSDTKKKYKLHKPIRHNQQDNCLRVCCQISRLIRNQISQDNIVRRRRLQSKNKNYKSTQISMKPSTIKVKQMFGGLTSFCNNQKTTKKRQNTTILPELKQFHIDDLEDDHETRHKITSNDKRRLLTEEPSLRFKTQKKEEHNLEFGIGTLKKKESKIDIDIADDKEEDDHTSISRPFYKYIENKKVIPEVKETHLQSTIQKLQKSLRSSSLEQKNTLFHQNKLKYSTSKLKQSNIVIENKFTVPSSQQQISQFILRYTPIDPEFDLPTLVKALNFKVQKKEGEVYFGEILDEKKQGKGILVTSKQLFEGTFINDQKSIGAQKNKVGVYKGRYVNGRREGKGQFRWNNGEFFKGEWINGKKQGYGIWTSPKGSSYEGQWHDNKQHGKGVFYHLGSKYSGYFKNFLKWGKGEEYFQNGDVYKGQYKQGKPHGYGKYRWSNGDEYHGQFVNGSRQGKGRLKTSESIYEGAFLLDRKDGNGKQTYNDGRYLLGTFQGGEAINGRIFSKEGIVLSFIN